MTSKTLSVDEAERVSVELAEALADPVFGDVLADPADLRLVASNAPTVARALLNLYRVHRETSERFAALDEALGEKGHELAATPWEDVRDFFHYCDNYVVRLTARQNISRRPLVLRGAINWRPGRPGCRRIMV